MNKYAAEGILRDALDGKRIAVVERTAAETVEAVRVFAELVERLDLQEYVKVRRANGAERVRVPGAGDVRFATPRSRSLRGCVFDVVFIDNDAHRELEYGTAAFDRFRDDIAGVLATTAGEVVYS